MIPAASVWRTTTGTAGSLQRALFRRSATRSLCDAASPRRTMAMVVRPATVSPRGCCPRLYSISRMTRRTFSSSLHHHHPSLNDDDAVVFDPTQFPLSAALLKQDSSVENPLSDPELKLQVCLQEYQTLLQSQPRDLVDVLDRLYHAYMALEYWEEALEVQRHFARFCQEGTCEYAESMHNQGKLQLRLGNFEASKRLYEQALEHFLEQNNKVQEGHVYISMAGWYFFRHEEQPQASLLDTAMEYLVKAEGLLNTNPTLLVKCLDNQGLIHRMWHDYEQALQVYQQALQVVPDDSTRQALQFHIADMHVALENPHLALALYQELLQNCQQQPLGTRNDNTTTWMMQGVLWHNIATLHVQLGEYTLAEDEFRQALHWKQTAAKEFHPELAKTWNALGALYYGHLGEAQQALECFRHVLWIARAHSDYEDHAQDPEVMAALQTISDIEAQFEKER